VTQTERDLGNQRWMDWAVDRWLEMAPGSPEAETMIRAIMREQRRRILQGEPRKLVQRGVLMRLDPQRIRNRIWLRARRALRRVAPHAW
jgi:hypothetical protein